MPITTVLSPTSTPIPTATLHPEFVELQNLISDSGQRFTLLPDGNIEDNGVVIPNLHVDQNGIINLIINNEHVVIEQSQITFDDENVITIIGYTLNENGEWVEAVGTTTIVNGLEMVLGEVDTQGNRPVVEFIAPDELSYGVTEEEWLARLDPTEIGYDFGELNWVVNGTTGAIELQNSDGEAVATWKEVGTRGRSTVVWDAQKMGQGDDHPFHNIGIVYQANGGRVVDFAQQHADFTRNWDKIQQANGELAFDLGLDWKIFFSGFQVHSSDRTTITIVGVSSDGVGTEDLVAVITPDDMVKVFLVENIEGSSISDPRN